MPVDTINNNNVLTITYLKAEDSKGELYDILGKHIFLPIFAVANNRTVFRFFVGNIQHTNTTNVTSHALYLAIHDTHEQIKIEHAIINPSHTSFYDISILGNYTSAIVFFELYVYSENNEKIVLSSGYTKGTL